MTYKYSDKKPSKGVSYADFEPYVDHRPGFKRRKDELIPTSKRESKVYCACGWVSTEWTTVYYYLRIEWYKHVMAVKDDDVQA